MGEEAISALTGLHCTRSPCSQRKAEFKLPEAYRKPSGLHCVGYDPLTRQSGFGLWTEYAGRPWRSVQTRESPSSYGLTFTITNAWEGLHEAPAEALQPQATSPLRCYAITDKAAG